MADNITLNSGAGGAAVRTDDDGTAHWQYVKLAFGADNTQTIVSTGSPLPVGDGGGSLTVDGTVTANLSATDNAVLDAIAASVAGTLTVGSHNVTNAGTFAVQATQAGSWTATAVGAAAENGAVSGNPVLMGGRFDSTPRTLDNGDVGAFAVNSSGHMLVEISAGAGSGGTAAADDADFTAGTTSGTPAMGVYESSPTSVTDGDLGVVGITVNRELKTIATQQGTWTVNLGATDNNVLDSIDAAVNGTLSVNVVSYADSQTDDAGYTVATDTLAVVGGVVTADSVDSGDAGAFAMSTDRHQIVDAHIVAQDAAVQVSDGGGSLTVDGTVTATGAAAENAAVSGNPVLAGGRYDSVARTLGDGDAGALALNASGQLLVEIAAGAGSGGTAAADDADFTAGTTSGTPAMGVYESSPTSVTDGDLGVVGITQTRSLKVHISGSDVSSSGGTSAADDADFTAGVTAGTPAMGVYESAPSSVTDGDVGLVGITQTRQLRTSAAQEGTWNITNVSGTVSLPTGAATAANQSTANGLLTDIETNTNFGAVTGGGLEATALRVTLANDSTGVLSVDDNGGSLTVDGTVAATQSGTWNVTDISGTISLPTGAATAANQATANGLLTDIETNTNFGAVVGGGLEATALRVTLANDSTGVLSVDDNGGSLTVDGTVAATQSGTWNITNISGTVSLPTGAATSANQTTANSALSAIQTAVETLDNAIAGTEMQVDVVAALPAGTNNIGDVDVASIAAGTNLIGDVGISGARTSGGTTAYKNLDVDESEDEIKASGGQVYWIHCMNLATTTRYLKFYNATAANVTVGTTTPVLTFPIPTLGDTNGAGFNLAIPNGIAFSTAITIAATTGLADNDTGAPGANEVVVNLGYA